MPTVILKNNKINQSDQRKTVPSYSYTNQTKKDVKSRFKNLILKLNSTKSLLMIVIILLIVISVLLINLIYGNPVQTLMQNVKNNQVISSVSSQTQIDKGELGVIAILTNVSDLVNASSINTQVYKDAKNGDYVLSIQSNKQIIIYRPDSNKIVYQGDTPTTILNKNQQALNESIVSLAKTQNLLSTSSTEVPELNQVLDITQLVKSNPSFYKNVQKGDVIAYFPNAQIVILYRSSSNQIINSGKL